MMIAWLLYIPVDVFILSICANHMCYNSLFTIAIYLKRLLSTLTNDLFFYKYLLQFTFLNISYVYETLFLIWWHFLYGLMVVLLLQYSYLVGSIFSKE